jgi:hypothetical protein
MSTIKAQEKKENAIKAEREKEEKVQVTWLDRGSLKFKFNFEESEVITGQSASPS